MTRPLTITQCVTVQVEDLHRLLVLAVVGQVPVPPADDHDLLLPRLLPDQVAGGEVALEAHVRPRRPRVRRQVQEIRVVVGRGISRELFL